jgi:uncharacterized protein involved in exopolysaccharide biosynthesis
MNIAVAMNTESGKKTVDARERWRAYWRRRRTFLLTFLLSATAAVLLALLLPATYRSTATILIEQQEIPQELVRSVITSFADQRVQVISQRVMTTQNLLQLIERYDLYPAKRQREPREELLQDMRDDIGMKMISADVIDPRSGRPTQATIAFTVSYQSRSPDLALKVANDLTSLYLNENLTSRSQMSLQETTFFGEEAKRQQAHIDELDQALSAFKKKHHDDLPELEQLNVQSMERTELDLKEAQNKLDSLDSQRVLLQAQLAQINPTAQVYSDTGQRVMGPEDRLKILKSLLASYKAKYAPDHPDVVTTQREVDGLEKEVKSDDDTSERMRQLEEAKAELVKAQQKYSPDHPDVIRLEHEVASLQAEVTAAAAAGKKRPADSHADNPAYIQVKGQLDSVDVEREAALKRVNDLRAKIDDYERRLTQAPDVERQFREMARDLDTAQLKYQEIMAKQTEVKVSGNLESERKGERFTMIEPPLKPEKPISPNRTLIIIAGLLLSLAAAAAAAAVHETLDGSVRGSNDIRMLLQIPPLATIPVIITNEDRKKRKRVLRYSWAGSIAFVVLAVVGIHFLVKPLDVVWAILLRRAGG